MFVYGKAGLKAPYAVNVLTLFKLTETLENIFSQGIAKSNNNFLVRVKLVKKNILFVVLLDATYN